MIATLILCALGVSVLVMATLWVIEYRHNNASYVDVGWVACIAISALIFATLGQGSFYRRGVLCGLICLWALRLGGHILKRVMRDPHEDKRYAHLRQTFGAKAHSRFLILFVFEAFLAVALCAGFIPAWFDANATWYPLQTIGIVMWCLAFWGESLADQQLKVFKSRAENRGKTCDQGLWYYSRHPNYFFEFMMWVAYAIYALPSQGGVWAMISPAIMLVFLLKLTGIPFSEQMALASRGENYRRYQATTSAFFPWFKRKESL